MLRTCWLVQTSGSFDYHTHWEHITLPRKTSTKFISGYAVPDAAYHMPTNQYSSSVAISI